jgi:hypothetical protein
MEMVDEALVASRANDSATAEHLRRNAFELERSAAQSLEAEVSFEPTRSILFRSAATLALRCGDRREAERLARAGLTETTPAEIRVEIEALLDELGPASGASTVSEVKATRRAERKSPPLEVTGMAENGSESGSSPSDSDLICKVLSTMDYLKVCADHKAPTGEGVPLDIVIMPDFVVDVDGAAIVRLNESEGLPGGRIAAAEIGSRAGRVLSILAHLRDRDDDRLKLHYIAKTGATGRALLHERLQRDLDGCGIDPVRFPFLIPATQTRFAILGRNRYVNVSEGRQIVRSTDENRLKASELYQHIQDPMQVIRGANALYFGTDALSQFKELIEVALLGGEGDNLSSMTNPGFRFIFVDLAAIHTPDEQRSRASAVEVLGRAIAKLEESPGDMARRTLLTVIVKRGATPAQALFRKLGLRKGMDLVVAHSASEFHWSDGDQTRETTVEIDPVHPHAREAFVAGMVLHRAVASAWSTIPRKGRFHYKLVPDGDWTHDLFPDPYCETAPEPYWKHVDAELTHLSRNWPVAEAVQFGKVLARLWGPEPSHTIPDRHALLSANLEREENTSAIGTGSDSVLVDLARADPRRWYKRVLQIEGACMRKGARPDGSFLRHLWQAVQGREDMSEPGLLEHPPEWGNQAQVLRLASWTTVRAMVALRVLRNLAYLKGESLKLFTKRTPAAYLTDLDGTLLHSSALRSTCFKNAMLGLLAPRGGVEQLEKTFPVLPEATSLCGEVAAKQTRLLPVLDQCNELYHCYVYDQFDFWRHFLGSYPYYNYGNYPRDFKQVWNHRLSYSVFLWVLRRLTFAGGVWSIPGCPAEIVFPALDPTAELLKLARSERKTKCEQQMSEWIDLDAGASEQSKRDKRKDIYRQINNIETKYERYYEEAAKRFWEVDFEPFRQTRESIRTLQDVFGVETYVATEGHHETQLKKITVLGLDHFFAEMTVLSTGAAVSTHEDLRNVRDEMKNLRETLRGLRDVLSRVTPGSVANDLQMAVEDGERKMEHLRIYEDQWRTFEDKTTGTIFPLIVASVMVDPVRPFLGVTDLRQLVKSMETRPVNIHDRHFAMVGDREERDIEPVIKSCNTSGPNSERVSTAHFVTADHKDDYLYTDGREGAQAKYVAWTPTQALLCLAREEGWSAPLGYGTMPAIIPGRLADQYGQLKPKELAAMVWGFTNRGGALQTSTSLINFLILKSTLRDPRIGHPAFLNALRQKLASSRSRADGSVGDWGTYAFMLEVFSHVVLEAAYTTGVTRLEMASSVRDALCDEFRADFGGTNTERHGHYVTKAIYIFRQIVYPPLKGGPLCGPPSTAEARVLLDHVPDFMQGEELEGILVDWR